MPAGGATHRIPDATRDLIVQLYNEGKSAQAVADVLGLSKPGCLKVLGERGVPRRRCGRPRQAPVHEDFFDDIRTEEQAYWLGFISADGCVTGNYLKICLAAQDKSHLEACRDMLCPGRRLYFRSGGMVEGYQQQDRYDLVVWSLRLCSMLGYHGVVERKTHTIEPCPNVSDDLLQHYWRGYFDGDGCVCYAPFNGNPNWALSVVGTKPMMLAFRKWLSRYVPRVRMPVRVKGVWRICCGGTGKPRLFAKALYEGATIYLPRKMEAAQRLIAYKPLRKTEAYAA